MRNGRQYQSSQVPQIENNFCEGGRTCVCASTASEICFKNIHHVCTPMFFMFIHIYLCTPMFIHEFAQLKGNMMYQLLKVCVFVYIVHCFFTTFLTPIILFSKRRFLKKRFGIRHDQVKYYNKGHF